MKLRFGLLSQLPGTLPAACQLPKHYALDVITDHDVCPHCGSRLRRVRSSMHFPIGLMLGRPRVRLIHRQCTNCRQSDSFARYDQHVPHGSNYSYDVIVEVGLARFCTHRQDAEIQGDLQRRWGLSLPASSVGSLVHSFLDGLSAVHQAHTPAIRQRLAEDGGFALHFDGSCEPGTHVLFTANAEPRGWTLAVAKIPTENTRDIRKLMQSCVNDFGLPLATMRDLSGNIAKAKREAIPKARDLICHFHFLENVGNKLCETPHAKLTNALRRLKVRANLKSLRHDLVRWTRKGQGLSEEQIEHLCAHPEDIDQLDAVAVRRYAAYMLLRWLDDYTADLRGEYFPFDLPTLAFYRRGVQLSKLLSDLLASPDFPRKELSVFNTMSRHLAPFRDNAELIAAAKRLEKAAALFEEFRKVLRLNSRPGKPLLRGRDPSAGAEDSTASRQFQKELKAWRIRLRMRHQHERDPHKRADQAIVLKYLKKYEKQLVGHVIQRKGREPFVVCRTNNAVEHRFGSLKRGVRRKAGTKKLTRLVQAMRPEALLIPNLADPEYVNLVLGGSLAELPKKFAEHWSTAQAIRHQRRTDTTDRPMPTTKQQLRNPGLLEKLKRTIKRLAAAALGTKAA